MNCKDSEKPGAEPGRPLPCIPLGLPPHGRKNHPSLREGAPEGGKKRPTVGRRKNLLWVVDATYRRSVRRPTVGFFRVLWETLQAIACGAGLRDVGEDAVLCLSEGECKPCLFGRMIGVVFREMISVGRGGIIRGTALERTRGSLQGRAVSLGERVGRCLTSCHPYRPYREPWLAWQEYLPSSRR